MSFGEALLAFPGVVLSSPFIVLEGVASGVVHVATSGDGGTNIFRPFIDPNLPVAPFISYGGQSGLAGGVRLQRRPAFDTADRLRFKATYSIYDYSRVYVKYENERVAGSSIGLTGQVDYARRPRESFYGLGNDSDEAQEVSFTLEETTIRGELFWHPVPTLDLGGFASWRHAGMFDGRDPGETRSLPTIIEQFDLAPTDTRASRYVSVGGLLDFDYRDHEGQPSSGGRIIAEFSFNHGVGDSDDLEFTTTRVELQQYFDVWHKRILAFRAVVQDVDRSDDVSPNPIYLLSPLGGQTSLRSYQSARFIDRDMAMATLEYRYPVWDVIDAFLFLDEGRVFRQIGSNFSWRNWHHSAGFGLRIWTEEEVIGTVTIAAGKEGTRFFFQLGQVF